MLAPGAALAWSNDQHLIVCRIAFERLTSEGKAFVASVRAMDAEIEAPFPCPAATPAPGDAACPSCKTSLCAKYGSFETSCQWPDWSRQDTFKGTYENHYVNVPKAETEFSINRDCGAMDCAVVAIQRFAQYLAQPAESSRPKERKALALRFVGHFVGDLHQPLHVGFVEDLGGNRITVKMPTPTGGTTTANLHSVWDGKILERGGLDEIEDGTALNAEITPAEAASWENFDIKAWAAESYELARSKAYSHADGTPVANGETLSAAYLDAAFPVAKERLKKAGVRLAFLINAAAAGTLPANMIKFE